MMRRTTSAVRYAVAVAGLTMDGTPARKAGRELLEHSPHRKIERIDVDRRAFARQIQVLPDEAAALREAFEAAVENHLAVRQLTRRLAGKCKDRTDAAIDVDP